MVGRAARKRRMKTESSVFTFSELCHMPKLNPNSVPAYRLHKQSGQAIVTLSGKDVLLGAHGTAASRKEYDRRIAEWVAAGRQLPSVKKRSDHRRADRRVPQTLPGLLPQRRRTVEPGG